MNYVSVIMYTHIYLFQGFGNIVQNKGGVAIAFNLFDIPVAFINCHLAARPSKGLTSNSLFCVCEWTLHDLFPPSNASAHAMSRPHEATE